MRLKMKQGKKAVKGQGLLEFALVLPVFFLLVTGIIDFGWMIYNYSQLYNGLREALRYGSVTGYDLVPQYQQCDKIKDKLIKMAMHSGIRADQITIVYDDGRPVEESDTYKVAFCVNNATNVIFNSSYFPVGSLVAQPRTEIYSGDRIVMVASVNVHFLTPFFGTMFPNGLPIELYASRTIYPGGLGL